MGPRSTVQDQIPDNLPAPPSASTSQSNLKHASYISQTHIPSFSSPIQANCEPSPSFSAASQNSKLKKIHSGPHSQEFVCGGGAALVEVCITFPIHKLIFRQQLHGIYLKGILHNYVKFAGKLASLVKAREEFSDGRAMAAHRSHSPAIRNFLPGSYERNGLSRNDPKVPCRALMFGTFEEYQRLLGCGDSKRHFSVCHAAAAFMAGTTEACLTPLERLQVLLQHTEFHHKFRNSWEAFRILKPYGLKEYYRGLTPILLRNGTSNILFFSLRGPLKQIISEGKQGNFAADFITGAVLGATLSTVFYPVNVVKTRMQSKLGGAFDSPFRVFRKIWLERNRSAKEMFRGVQLNYSRSLLTWGITNTVYEYLEKALFRNEE